MAPDQYQALMTEVQSISASVQEVDKKVNKLALDLKDARIDTETLSKKLGRMIRQQMICQSRCHVPGPPSILRRTYEKLLTRFKKPMPLDEGESRENLKTVES